MLKNPVLHRLEKFYNFFLKIGSNLQSAFLFYMRFTWGHQLFLIGMDKLKHPEDSIQLFTTLGIPAPHYHVYEFAILEIVGGICIFLGFASRIATIPVIALTATYLGAAHAKYFATFQFVTSPHTLVIAQPFPYLITALMVFVFGPGRLSIDAWIKRWVGSQPRY